MTDFTSRLSKYKKEILWLLIGALFTGVISLSSGLYTLNKSYQLTQKADLLFRLKKDIYLLRKAEKELDINLSLLLNQRFQINIEVEKSPPSKGFEPWGSAYRIKKSDAPEDRFVLDAWPFGGPNVTEMDLDIVFSIDDLYRRLFEINRSIDEANFILKRPGLFMRDREVIERLNIKISRDIALLTQERIVALKNQIAGEVIRLQKKLKELQQTLD